jgi:hypothetical protein
MGDTSVGVQEPVSRQSGRLWFFVVLSGLLAGCGPAVRPDYPDEPLLISKKPVEMKQESTKAALVYEEPPLPAPPASALVTTPPEFEKYVRMVKRMKPAKPADSPTQTAPSNRSDLPTKMPAVQPTPVRTLPALQPTPTLPDVGEPRHPPVQ